MNEKRMWIYSARASFYTFLGDLYHQLYVGSGGSAALFLDDRSWRPEITAEMREEIEKLLEQHKIRERFRTDYDEEYGVLRAFTEKEKK